MGYFESFLVVESQEAKSNGLFLASLLGRTEKLTRESAALTLLDFNALQPENATYI